MKDKLSLEDAYKAMIYFIEQYNSRLKSDDIFVMLGAMDLVWLDKDTGKNLPGDPALWKVWVESVEKISNS